MNDVVQDDVRRFPGVGLPITQQLVEHDANGENVAAGIDDLALHLLGRHVVRRSHHRAGQGQPGARHVAGDAREPEVENLEGPFGRDHQIAGLDVAVDDPVLVRVTQPGTELEQQLQAAVDAERRPSTDHLGHGFPIEEFHRDKGLAVVLADVVNGDDVIVFEGGRRPRFAREAFAKVVVMRREAL